MLNTSLSVLKQGCHLIGFETNSVRFNLRIICRKMYIDNSCYHTIYIFNNTLRSWKVAFIYLKWCRFFQYHLSNTTEVNVITKSSCSIRESKAILRNSMRLRWWKEDYYRKNDICFLFVASDVSLIPCRVIYILEGRVI